MIIPIEMLTTIIALVGSVVIALQAWILIEIVALKVRLSNYEQLAEKVEQNNDRLIVIEAHCGIQTTN